MKAELAAGFVLVSDFTLIAMASVIGFEYVGLRWHTAVVSAGSALAVVNLTALCWWSRT